MKKLVLIVDKYPFNIGGMETHAHEFIKFFKKQKRINLVLLIAFSINIPKKLVKNKNKFNIPLIIFPEIEIYDGNALVSELNKFGIRDHDILFFNSLYWIRIFPKIRLFFPKTKLILRSGGNDLIHAQIAGMGKKLKERQSFVVNTINQNIDILIVNSVYSYDRFENLGIIARIMRVFIGGVDVDRFTPKNEKIKLSYRKKLKLPNTIIILTVCRFVPFKNLPLTLKSIYKIKNKRVIHVLVGGGPEFFRIKKIINKLNIHDKVILTGIVPLEKIHYYYQASDIYCQTSVDISTRVEGGAYMHTETMGRSFCEALATGLPVVTTNIGGVKEIISNKQVGFIAEKNKAEDIGQCLDLLVNDIKLCKKMGAWGRKYALKKLSWKIIFKNYLKKLFI